jgi:GNAT superfamily N-acetyltransferase
MDIEIRRADPDDAPAVSRLIRSLAHHFLLSPDGQGAERFMASTAASELYALMASPHFHYLTAWQGGELVGVAGMRDHTHLYHLFVAPQAQRQGLARRLWSTLLQAACLAGKGDRITVNSSPVGVPVYERLGFRVEGTEIRADGIRYTPMTWVRGVGARPE